MLLYPSLMGANQLTLADIINTLEPWCAGFHLDTMDGHAAPNITGGPCWTNAIAHATKKPVWVHLMVTDPVLWIKQLDLKTASMVDFQYEGTTNHHNVLAAIKKKGYKAGISIAPETSLEKLYTLIPFCDYITVMGVKPGFSGQLYIPETTKRLQELSLYIKSQKLPCALACDGGITEALLPVMASHGVSHAAVASALFNAPDPISVLKKYTL